MFILTGDVAIRGNIILNVLSPYRLQCRTTLQVAARAVARLLAISCPNWQHEQRVIQRKSGPDDLRHTLDRDLGRSDAQEGRCKDQAVGPHRH